MAQDPAHVAHDPSQEIKLALINGLKLGLSLFGTVLVSVGLNIWLPHTVGPEKFGQLNSAEALATGLFAFTTFGIDTYIRKEVAHRPEHASDFYAGFVILRLAASVVVLLLMAGFLLGLGEDALGWRLAYLYAGSQICLLLNFSESALLQAIGRVTEMAWANVLSKVFWASSVCGALLWGAPLESVAAGLFLSEALKAAYLTHITHRSLKLRWHVDMTATWAVVVASFPYFINNIAHRTYEQLNKTILSGMTDKKEVGWYSGSVRLAAISLLFIPIVQAVLIPMATRMKQRSEEAMNEVMRGAQRLVLVAGALMGLILLLHTEAAVYWTIGRDFGPSVLSLRVLAPMFTLTYMAVLGAVHLIQLDLVSVMIKVSLAALVVNPLFNVPFIYWGYRMGPGWAGAMSALSSVITEALNAGIIFAVLGRRAVDGRLLRTMALTLGICALVVGLHWQLRALALWRIPIEVLAYLVLAVALGALPVADVMQLMRNAPRRGPKPQQERKR